MKNKKRFQWAAVAALLLLAGCLIIHGKKEPAHRIRDRLETAEVKKQERVGAKKQEAVSDTIFAMDTVISLEACGPEAFAAVRGAEDLVRRLEAL